MCDAANTLPQEPMCACECVCVCERKGGGLRADTCAVESVFYFSALKCVCTARVSPCAGLHPPLYHGACKHTLHAPVDGGRCRDGLLSTHAQCKQQRLGAEVLRVAAYGEVVGVGKGHLPIALCHKTVDSGVASTLGGAPEAATAC